MRAIEVEIPVWWLSNTKKNKPSCQLKREKNSSRGLELDIFQNPTCSTDSSISTHLEVAKSTFRSTSQVGKSSSENTASLFRWKCQDASYHMIASIPFFGSRKSCLKKMTPADLEFCLALEWQANLVACSQRTPPPPILLLQHLFYIALPFLGQSNQRSNPQSETNQSLQHFSPWHAFTVMEGFCQLF